MIVAIFGAGPAGMSCANACVSFGLEPVVIEREHHAGGAQHGNFHHNLWLLGTPEETGQELTRRLVAHYRTLATTTLLGTTLLAARAVPSGFELRLRADTGDSELTAQAMVVATGMRTYATAELTALADRSERVIVGPLNATIRDGIRSLRTLILGGGDNALDHALYLAARGNQVCVATRGAFSGREALLAACRAHPAIRLRAQCQVTDFSADAQGACVRLDGEPACFDWLLVMYGYRPNTEWLTLFAEDIRPACNARGHLAVDAWQRTNVPGIYAAGDVIDNVQPSIPTAIAQGLAAAKAIERDAKAGRLRQPVV